MKTIIAAGMLMFIYTQIFADQQIIVSSGCSEGLRYRELVKQDILPEVYEPSVLFSIKIGSAPSQMSHLEVNDYSGYYEKIPIVKGNDGVIYIAEISKCKILKYDVMGNFIGSLNLNKVIAHYISELFVDEENNLYFKNYYSTQKYSSGGKLVNISFDYKSNGTSDYWIKKSKDALMKYGFLNRVVNEIEFLPLNDQKVITTTDDNEMPQNAKSYSNVNRYFI